MKQDDNRMEFVNFLAFVFTLLMFFLWFIPAFMIYHTDIGQWGILYLPIAVLHGCWMWIVYNKYFRN